MRELMNAPFYVSLTNPNIKVWAYKIKSFEIIGIDEDILRVQVSSKKRYGYPAVLDLPSYVKEGVGMRNGGYIVYYEPNDNPIYVSSIEFQSVYKLSPESNYWLGELLEDVKGNDDEANK